MNDEAAPAWVEPAKVALLFAWLLVSICSYYVLRPVRSAMVMAHFGPRILPWIYMGTGLFTGVAVWVYSCFTHLPRRKLIGGVVGFFLMNFLVLWQMMRSHSTWVSPVLYVWVDIFSIMSTTTFWMYANDIYAGDKAKKHFGKIGAAGMTGAFIGAWLTKTLVGHLGIPTMMLVSGGIYALVLVCMAGLEVLTGGQSARRDKEIEKFEKLDFGGLGAVIKSVSASRTLTLLVAVVCMERFVPDFVDYIFSSAMHAAYPTEAGYASIFASFELWRNAVAAAAAFLVTSHMLKYAGVNWALTAVPISIIAIGGAYIFLPGLAVAIALKGMEEGQRHVWFKAGKEVIYTATNKDVIYKVKAYIEMFVYRFARGLAGGILLILTEFMGCGPRGVAVAMLPLALAWAYFTWTLGSDYEKLERGPV
ncbi:MAG: hypothetical protein HY925_05650 [Elusimicrobia bacterium]|nr:hypothetical protein [Elusimicrobiota bacterium]